MPRRDEPVCVVRVAGVCAGVCDAGMMLASLVVVMRVALVLAQPAGRWRAAGRIGLEHCDAGAGARWLGARSLLDHGAGAQRYAESGVVQPRCGVVPGERWCAAASCWGAAMRARVRIHSARDAFGGGRDGGGRD